MDDEQTFLTTRHTKSKPTLRRAEGYALSALPSRFPLDGPEARVPRLFIVLRLLS